MTATPQGQIEALAREPDEMEAKPLLEHLRELRRTLLFCLAVILVFFILIFSLYSKQLVNWVSQPIEEMHVEIIYTAVSEAFTCQLKLCFIAAVVAASPFVFGSLWLFIRPALYRGERKAFALLTLCGLFLFVVGVVFAYEMVFRLAVNFFIVSGENVATPMLSLDRYVSFLFSFLLPFGVMFQLPIAVAVLTRLGLVDAKLLSRSRKYIIFIIFVVAAVLTPPDVISQLLLGLPLLLLVEISIFLSRFIRARAKNSAAPETAEDARP